MPHRASLAAIKRASKASCSAIEVVHATRLETLRKWKGLVQHALDIACQHAPRFRISEWDERDTRAELLTNIHISTRATRKTVELFDCGDPKLLPVGTNVFAVSAQLNEFLASVIAGAVNPVWMATVDSEWTPGCRNGTHPQYSLRKV
ncbi:hypothetical protein [Xenorhabdus bovienii]|uniref:hypothetical protein n=1 Tax=Xenorhabdus bovienii TaxID=40576 RepID=UPI003DA3877D